MNLLQKVVRKFKNEGVISVCLAFVRYPQKIIHRSRYKKMLAAPAMKDRFTRIYDENLWGSAESGSGVGSELAYTAPLRDWLAEKFPELNISVFVDAPCGDYHWMRELRPELDGSYIGLDLVDSVIAQNKDQFGTKETQFHVADITRDPLPTCDLIMVRDCLFHLSFDDIDHFLQNLSKAEYRYFLTTTHLVDDGHINSDIETGDFRIIDLFSEPFGFKDAAVIDKVNDFPEGHHIPREMVLLHKKDVPTSLASTTSRSAELG